MRDPRFARAYRVFPEQTPTEEELAAVRKRAAVVAEAVPDLGQLEDLFKREWRLPRSAEEFHSTLTAAIAAKDESYRAWMSALRTLIDADVRRHREERWFVAMSLEWQKKKNPFRAWDRTFSNELRGIDYRAGSEFLSYLLYLLYRIDRHIWFETLDAFPFPNFAYTALWEGTRIAHDRDLIEELLRVAPIALSPGGEWLPPCRVTTLLLLEMIVSHANMLWRAVDQYQRDARVRASHEDDNEPLAPKEVDDELAHLANDELPNRMRSAFRIVLDRPDGQPLLIGYLAHLCDTPAMSHRRHEAWDAHDHARRILAEELAGRNTTVQTIRNVWNRSGASATEIETEPPTSTSTIRRLSAHEGEGARGSSGQGGEFLYAAAMIVEAQTPSESENVDLWQFLEERLVARDRIFRSFNSAQFRYDAPNLFARLLARLSAPEKALQNLYRQLEPQRRRALFWLHYENERDAEEGSHFLIHLGLCACTYGETWSATKLRHELFWWLYDAARRLWLTSRTRWSSTDDEERFLVARCFAFMPAVFGDALTDALPRALAPIRNDPWLLSMAGTFLWRKGIEPAEVVRLFQNGGVHVPTALRDAYQWVSISENRQRRVDPASSEFPLIARDFAAALSVVFDTNLPIPQRPSLHNEFLSTLPWGSALWKSLEDDGFTNIRIHLLTAQTWLLQTTAPESLRQRFGLSPDVRILAVHGQLVGRDVRFAMSKPIDADAVDSDLLVVACDHSDFAKRLASRIPGPFGQRIPWIPSPKNEFPPLAEMFRDHVGRLDLFEYRDPVHGNALIGRHQEIEELTQRLLRGEAVGVFGLRKVGKSSMMEAVAERLDPIGARLGMFRFYGAELPERADPAALVVSFDAQSVAAKSLSNLVARLLEYFDERLELAGLPKNERERIYDEDPIERFRQRLGVALERLSLPICFMIDEYDLLFAGYGGEGGLAGIEQFFALLRAEANASRRVSLALVGRDPAFVDAPHIGGFTNPLLGWVYHQYLGPLRRDEADELLVRLGKRMGLEIGSKSLDLGWQWTGGHPLLLRQYGSTLLELAHSPGTRPRPAPTDPICADAIEVFPSRNAVRTINGEIDTLLAVRFPESSALLRVLAGAAPTEVNSAVRQRGGEHSRALRVLLQFGIVKMESGNVWLPEIFRHEFGSYSAPEAHEVAGEE